MDIYQLRIWKGSRWNTVQTYGTRKEAEEFATDNLNGSVWNVKRVTLEQAVLEESN